MKSFHINQINKLLGLCVLLLFLFLFQFSARAAVATAPASAINTGDNAWLLTSSALVLMMTAPGLILFYGGLVGTKTCCPR